MKKNLWLTLFFVLASLYTIAVPVTGVVKNAKGEVLPFASIVVKGMSVGTTANNEGSYSLNLANGKYILQCMHVGYTLAEKEVVINAEAIRVDFILSLQELTLKEVVVGGNVEDPAYEIIRQAIKKRPYYKNQVDAFECQVYIKGQLKLKDYPSSIFGQKVTFDDGSDSSKNKMIYLSETIAKYYFQKPAKEKAVVTSTRVSGSAESFGFSNPKFLTFYDNNIQISNVLNPRGFISPIADNALSFYRYKFLGSYVENGKIINKIKVIPRRTFEPLFSGDINIVEDDWRIHSVNLLLTKSSQMELADSLHIEHLYVPVSKDVWMIHSQVLYPSVKMLGFDAAGSFVSVYSNYNLNPQFDKKFFDNIVLKYDSGSNKMPRRYWDTVRPVPLLNDEVLDYVKKDSMEIVRRDPKYLDSLDRRRNKITVGGLLLFGQTFTRQSKKTSFSYPPLIEVANFNTVEGFNLNLRGTYTRRFTETKAISITPTVRYGFTNHHFNTDLLSKYTFGTRHTNVVSVSGGKRVFQINNEEPVNAFVNTYNTLFWGENYMKIYEAWFGKLEYTRGIGDGFTIKASVNYQDRIPLENTDNTFWGKAKNLDRRTANYPLALTNSNFLRHQSLVADFTVSYRPGTKYIQLPERKINIGSRYPLFSISYAKGLNGVAGSDVDYDRWKFSIKDDINAKLAGMFSYNISAGGFLNKRKVSLPDYQHFNGNQLLTATEYLNSFQLLPYYARSTTAKLYGTLNIEHHFNGFLTNKIPFIKKLNIYLVAGTNAFVVDKNNNYYEIFAGIENVLKIIRIDYLRSYGDNGYHGYGFRIGFRGVTGN